MTVAKDGVGALKADPAPLTAEERQSRRDALDLAVKASDPRADTGTIVARAEAFAKFLGDTK